MPGWVNIGEDNYEISCKAKVIKHFFSLFEVIAGSKLMSWKRHYHDGASSKDDLVQRMQHGFGIFQFYAQRYDNMDPK